MYLLNYKLVLWWSNIDTGRTMWHLQRLLTLFTSAQANQDNCAGMSIL